MLLGDRDGPRCGGDGRLAATAVAVESKEAGRWSKVAEEEKSKERRGYKSKC